MGTVRGALTVAVTGAGGKTGHAVLSAVAAAGGAARALVRDARKGEALPHPAVEPVAGDMTDVTALERLLSGCDVVYHIPPNMSLQEADMAGALVAACHRAGVGRLVYHSVLHPQCRTMPHHWDKLEVEALLLRSGLDTVFVQPAPYLQNLHPYLRAALQGAPTPFPYGAHVVLSMVDLADVAEAAVAVLTGREHVGGTYQLCGAERHSQGEAWELACDALGLRTPFTSVTAATWRRTVGAELPEETAGRLVSMFEHYERHGLVGSSLPLTQLLGREPTTRVQHLDGFAV